MPMAASTNAGFSAGSATAGRPYARRACRNSRSSHCNSRCKCRAKSHEINRNPSPGIPRIWQWLGGRKWRAQQATESRADKVAERVGLTRALLALALRARCARPKSLPAILSNQWVRPHTLLRPIKKGPQGGPLFYCANGGEGGIRTHVPELPDHPISSRRRYDHFGTSPLT
jgi:hypothetical protein